MRARTHPPTVTYGLNVYYSTVNNPLVLYAGKSVHAFPLGDTFKPEEPLTRLRTGEE